MKHNLVMSDVRFDKTAHTYELYGHQLKGVTPIVAWMFPDTYAAIPDSVLANAAAYGTGIHEKCQLYDECGIMDDHPSIKAYADLCKQNGLQHICSEYLVDDGQNIASCIDKVFENASENIVLADIKATSKLHDERVRLQLSIYAWMFEQMNGERVEKIAAIWLPNPEKNYGQPTLKYLQRLPNDTVQEIVKAYLKGEDSAKFRTLFNLPTVADGQLPANLAEVELAIVELETSIKQMEAQEKEMKAGLLKLMQENNVKKWTGEHITLTRKDGGTRITLDSKKVQNEYPEVYCNCIKESQFSESLMVKIN